MFTEFSPIKRSLFGERVNSLLGIMFLGSCALWAMMIIWNVTNGDTPIDHALTRIIESSIEE